MKESSWRWLQVAYLVVTTGLCIYAIGERDYSESMAWLLLSLGTWRHMRGPLR